MKKNAEPIAISALQRKRLEKDVLERVIVVEFGGEESAFDALYAEGHVNDGQ
jgi:hypothetical protein